MADHFDYTTEQQRIIASRADTLSINAFAGTGKTATLVGFAQARPQQRMLYLAFNKSVAEAAKQRFPSHVDCRTSHSLAFATFGSRYKHKLGQPRSLQARAVLQATTPRRNPDEALLFADQALRAVTRFLISGNSALRLEHVGLSPAGTRQYDPQEVLDAAQRLWDAMQDAHIAAMPMPHDGYLKLYQLSKPDLRKYDVILLDEAQDTNPCLFQIFNRQQTGRVLVGDAHQNIYAFRGAMNAMDRLDGERHALTASFRFGSAIAGVANALLGTFKNEPLTLEGRGGPSACGPASDDLQTAYLHRTNAGLIERAIGLLQANARARIHFVGGAYNDHFETLRDAWRLMDGERGTMRDPFLRAFNSIGDLEDDAEATEDREIQARLSVVKKYTDRLPGLLDQLTAADEADPARAVASLTTAHKAKGMEWEQVILGGDFPETMDERRLPLIPSEIPKNAEANPLSADEANLIYVAATRARRQLAPYGSLGDLLEWSARHPRAVPKPAAPKKTLLATPRPRAGRRELRDLAVSDAAVDGLLRLV